VEKGRSRSFWGVALILIGAFLLAINLNLLPQLTGNLAAVFFAVLCLLFLGAYLTSGVKNWGWLFPAINCGTIAAAIWLAEVGAAGEIIASLILLGNALPFWIGYLISRENWGLLIPAWALTVIGAVPWLATAVSGEVVGAVVLFGIGIPFLVVYLNNRQDWWALIPAGVLILIGAVVLLEAQDIAGDLFGGLFMLGLGAVFLLVYWTERERWWALIPAGVLASIGLTAALASLSLPDVVAERLLGGAFFGGLALTFGALWLLRRSYPTGWSKYPAIGLAIMTGFVAVFGARTDLAWSLLLVGAGAWLLWWSWRGRGR